MGNNFEIENSVLKGEIRGKYNIIEKLNNDINGTIYKAVDKETGEKVSIKIFNKKYLANLYGDKLSIFYENLQNQFYIYNQLGNKYFIKLKKDFDTTNYYFLVFENFDITLENTLIEKGPFSIKNIKNIFFKLNIAFQEMYNKNIIHGGLNLSNILLNYEGENLEPMISDFGKKIILSNISLAEYDFDLNNYFLAPEVFSGEEINSKIDLWSIGIIIYALYFNEFPYNGNKNTPKEIYRSIISKPKLKKSKKNKEFNDLINKLLIIEPNCRISWEEYFNHSFWKINESDEDDYYKSQNKSLNIFDTYRNKYNDKYNKINIYYSLIDTNDNVETRKNKKGNFSSQKPQKLKKLEILNDDQKGNKMNEIITLGMMKKIQFTDLTKLVLYCCHLVNIDFLAEIPLLNLTELDLSNNKIKSIDTLTHLNFSKLRNLSLVNNFISEIVVFQKVFFKNLSILRLSYNYIQNIEVFRFVPFNHLEKLFLNSNDISNISVFNKVPFKKLSLLELNDNKITCDNGKISDLTINGLIRLDLSLNKIDRINGLNSEKYKNLISLNLGNNIIRDIKIFSQVKFAQLKHLNLSDNLIEDINSFSDVPFKYLEELNLSYNQLNNISILSQVPFKNLKILNLNGNRISNIMSLAQLQFVDLNELHLQNNLINYDSKTENMFNFLRSIYRKLKIFK